MDVNEAAGRIAREVVRLLAEQRGAQGPPAERVLVLGPRSAAPAVRAVLGQGPELVFCAEDPQADDAGRIILPFLSCADMADLAAGRAHSPEAAQVLRHLLAGRRVEALQFEYRSFRPTAPPALWRLYENYERVLAGYGLAQCGGAEARRFAGNVLTEKDVLAVAGGGSGRLSVAAWTKITPLAAEAAAKYRICIARC